MAKEKIITALDIGTTKICCLISILDKNNKLKICGIGENKSEGLSQGMIKNIRAASDSMDKAIDEPNTYQRELLELKIETLFLELLQLDAVKMKAFFQHILSTSSERMRYILEENLDMIEKVEDMYRLMRMSSSHFHKIFLEVFKISPKSWLDVQRMKKAAFLLSSTQKSILNIATECGYSTASWFIVQFKKYYNMTPKQYRIKNQH